MVGYLKSMSSRSETMSANVKHLLSSFDALSAKDKHEAAVEILRRLDLSSLKDLPEETLVALADELFSTLDAEETEHAKG